MEGQTNWAYVNDNGETIEYGTIDNVIDNAFYRSKLVIEFSRENSPECNEQNTTVTSVTKRIELETSRCDKAEKRVTFSSNDDQQHEETKRLNQKRIMIYCLYCIGLVIIAIGIFLVIVGSIKNLTGMCWR